MKQYDLITPEGTCDLLLEDCLLRRSIEKNLLTIFKSAGYLEVITPGLEFYDVFHLNSGYFPQEIMYKLTDYKGRLLVVRPDSTMPIARVVATQLKNNSLPLRLFYNQPVYMVNRSLSGQKDEIAQAGIELIGSNSFKADLEVLTTAIQALDVCDHQEFSLEIGHIEYFKSLLRELSVSEKVQEDIRVLIEAKNYPALNDLLDSIGELPVIKTLKQLPRLFGGEEVFEKASKLFHNTQTDAVLHYLKKVYTGLQKIGYNGKITVDLGIVNRTDYYTGIVMKGYLKGYGEAVLSGGRYDHLISEFGYDIPAVGFAVNVNAVSSVLRQKNEIPSRPLPDILVYGETNYETDALIYAQTLRQQGQLTETAVQDSYQQALNYAKEKGIPHVVRVGKEGAYHEC